MNPIEIEDDIRRLELLGLQHHGNPSFAPASGSATRERLKARMAGAVAALEGRKLDANHYSEESALHFEWLEGWTAARTEMKKSPSDPDQ